MHLLLPDDPDCVCNDALSLFWLCAGPNIIKGKEFPIIKDWLLIKIRKICPSASFICFDSAIAIALLHIAQSNQWHPTDPKLILCIFWKLCNLCSVHLTCLKSYYTFKLYHQRTSFDKSLILRSLLTPRHITYFALLLFFLQWYKARGGKLTLRLWLKFALI